MGLPCLLRPTLLIQAVVARASGVFLIRSRLVPPRLTARNLKIDGWKRIRLPFGAFKGLFSKALAVSFREGSSDDITFSEKVAKLLWGDTHD